MYLCSEKKGLPTATYLIYYGIVRTVLEQFRQEEYILRLGTMAISRLFSIAMIVIGVALFVFILIKARKKKVLNEKE
jgi:prolipoprotein diacylglyceryltransferase